MYFVPKKFVNFLCISNGAGGVCAPTYWRTDVSLRQEAMLTKHGKPILFRGFFFVFGPPFLLAQGALVRQ
jgi:hypothetical protein